MFLAVLHFLLVVGFTVRILLRDDLTPPSRLAWFLVVLALPLVGGLVYFLFGENSLGRSAVRHRAIVESVLSARPELAGDEGDIDVLIDPPYRPAFRYAASINGFNVVTGNRAELMEDAAVARARLLEDIDRAARSVNVLYYIWLQDTTGTDVARALVRAARRGVHCRAMADALGSRSMVGSALWREMASAGVDVEVALPLDRPVHTLLTSRIDLRNHRKITVIDGRITYCGSQNCADPEFRVKPKFAPWVDIMLRVEGPAVAQNQLLFAGDWKVCRDEKLENFDLIAETFPSGFPALVVGDGPTERRAATPQLFAALMSAATRTLTFSTPYFVPDATVLNAIQAAACRGVAVTVIVPKCNDSWIVSAASRSYYKIILASGATIHEYVGGLLHSKTLTIDGRITLMGSSNMDLRSFDLNYENDLLLQDDATTEAVSRRQRDYLAQCEEVTLARVEGWSIPDRLWNNVIATIGPVL